MKSKLLFFPKIQFFFREDDAKPTPTLPVPTVLMPAPQFLIPVEGFLVAIS